MPECQHLRVIWWRTPPYDFARRTVTQRFTEGYDCADCGAKGLPDSLLTIDARGGAVVRKVER